MTRPRIFSCTVRVWGFLGPLREEFRKNFSGSLTRSLWRNQNLQVSVCSHRLSECWQVLSLDELSFFCAILRVPKECPWQKVCSAVMEFCLNSIFLTYFFFELFHITFSAKLQNDVPLPFLPKILFVLDYVFVVEFLHDSDLFFYHLCILSKSLSTCLVIFFIFLTATTSSVSICTPL